MTGPDDDFGGYEEYEPSPYNGDFFESDDFDTFGPEDVEGEDEESDDDSILDDVEQALADELDAPGGEDAYLDTLMEDRISGLTGFELGD